MRLSVFIILLFTHSMQAKDASIGIKGGLNIANISGEDRDVFSSSIDFQARLFTEIHLTKHLLLPPELLFSMVMKIRTQRFRK